MSYKKNKLHEYTFQTAIQEDDEDFNVDNSFDEPQNSQNNNQQFQQQTPPQEQMPTQETEEETPSFDTNDIEDVEMEEDEVVDVTELVDGQVEIKTKVDDMMHQFKSIYHKIESLTNKIETLSTITNSKIETVKSELEKRVPTNAEKMNIRSVDSGPFTVSPVDYWREKSKDPNYEIYSDNSISPQDEKEYVIRQSDIERNMNPREISKSMEENYPLSLNDIINFKK